MSPKAPDLALRHNLKTLLETERISMSDLSRKTGIAKQVLSDWMAGTQPRNIAQVKLVAEYFHVSIDELCFNGRAGNDTRVVGHFTGRLGDREMTVRIFDSHGELAPKK